MGLYYEYITGYLYSIGEDKCLKVYDVTSQSILSENQVGNQPLTKMVI